MEESSIADFDAKTLLEIAQICGGLERDEDTIKHYIAAASKRYQDSPEFEMQKTDRAILARSLKRLINSQRSVVKKVGEQLKKTDGTDTLRKENLQEYFLSKSEELKNTCVIVVNAIKDMFLPMASKSVSRVFFNKLAGDLCRYICEIPGQNLPDVDLEEFKIQTNGFYHDAFDEAESDLSPAHPERLSLILNYATFLRDIKHENGKAIELIRDAYSDAAAELGIASPNEESFKPGKLPHSFDEGTLANENFGRNGDADFLETDSLKIMTLISKSLRSWTETQHNQQHETM